MRAVLRKPVTKIVPQPKKDLKKESKGIFVIRGGKPLVGEIVLRGAKNAVPKAMVAALLTDEPCVINNVPEVHDIDIVREMIHLMGGEAEHIGEGKLRIVARQLHPANAMQLKSVAGKSRIPPLFCGPLLARYGEVTVPAPGGCQIGSRPLNFHIDILRKLGATVEEMPDGGLTARADHLKGAKLELEYSSVGATEQAILASVLAEGVTEIKNAAVEPEVIDLVAVLQKMGAIISVDTDRIITVLGVSRLRGFEHNILPDRIEAASWACAALATKGRIFVRNAQQLDMMTFLNKYRQLGGEFEVKSDGILFKKGENGLHSIAIETDVHPGFMTDWQPPFVILLTQAHGGSIIHETVYENRFGYVKALQEMGAKIHLYHECLGSRHCRFGMRNHVHSAVVTGPTELHGAEITIPDLRAGFSYVIAALAAKGISTLHNIGILERGYEHFVEKLKALGADVVER